ncbi:MAG: MCE family protein [Actinobacteria bacterium]|nr:MCE family protein [Actinomycetota bacterium]
MITKQQRTVVVGAIAVALAVVLWLVMHGGGYVVNAEFETGGQLVKGGNVTVGGKPIGKIESIVLTDDNQANVRMRIDEDLAPLHRGTTATIRLRSLSGVANRYVSLAPGPNSAPEIPDGGVIKADETIPVVDLDQLFNAFTPKARQGLRRFLKGGAKQYADDPSTPLYEPAYGNEGLRWVAPFFDAAARIAAAVSRDDEVLAQFLVVSERATTTVAQQKEQLTALFRNMTSFMQAVSAESDELDRALVAMPKTLREGRSAFARLRPAMDALQKLSDNSEPIGDDLARMFRELRPLLENAEPVMHDLRLMVRKKGSYNDLTDLLAVQPSLVKKARTAFPNSTRGMQMSDEILDFLRPYVPDLTAWITHFGSIAANYDANGHYIRVQTVSGRFDYDGGTQELDPNSDKSLSAYPKTGTKRCPGAGTQTGTDLSNPFLDDGLDCDSSLVPPG